MIERERNIIESFAFSFKPKFKHNLFIYFIYCTQIGIDKKYIECMCQRRA